MIDNVSHFPSVSCVESHHHWCLENHIEMKWNNKSLLNIVGHCCAVPKIGILHCQNLVFQNLESPKVLEILKHIDCCSRGCSVWIGHQVLSSHLGGIGLIILHKNNPDVSREVSRRLSYLRDHRNVTLDLDLVHLRCTPDPVVDGGTLLW